MIGDLIKRFVNGMVFLLAVITFFLVPIGKKTAAQHAKAIFKTPPAEEAKQSFVEAASKLSVMMSEEIGRLRKELDLQKKSRALAPDRSQSDKIPRKSSPKHPAD